MAEEVSISALYGEAVEAYHQVDQSPLEPRTKEYQDSLRKTIARFEQLTLLTSQANTFSPNETVDELPTSSVKFLLLPARLACLTLKLQCLDAGPSADGPIDMEAVRESRKDILRMSRVYHEDFLRRCHQYEVTTYQLPSEPPAPLAAMKPPSNARPSPEELKAMGCQRQEKIRKLREQQALTTKLAEQTKKLQDLDEETLRQYYLDQIALAVTQSIEDLAQIQMETQMLERGPMPQAAPPKEKKPMRTFLITRDAASKAVYGAGYPSLPIMTVDEFYEKREHEGWWKDRQEVTPPVPRCPEGCSEHHAHGAGVDEEKERARLMARDEHKDTHRAGYGNTYNRS